MFRFVSLFLFGLAVLAQSPAERTRQVLDLVLARKYEQFYAMFSPEMQNGISLQTYSSQMDQLVALGKPEIGEPKVSQVQGYSVVMIPLRWPAGAFTFQVAWTADGKVAGTFVRPAPQPPAAWSAPDYVKAGSFTERDLTIGGDDRWKLPGTLTLPNAEGPFPAVVLVHGSGPHDRDETVGGAKLFRDLAEGLASRGIAVLRYVKRTRQYATSEAAPTMTAETVDDALRAVALLRTLPEIDARRVYVLGHSQGGYMMPRILQRDPKIAGGIVMAGNVRPLEALIVEQVEYLHALSGSTDATAVERVRKDPWSALPGITEAYRADLRGYDPAEAIRASSAPLLILQGERDYQVTMKDFGMWKAAVPASRGTFRSYPKLNHLFIEGEGKSNPNEYSKPGHVARAVVEDISAWLLQPRRSGEPSPE